MQNEEKLTGVTAEHAAYIARLEHGVEYRPGIDPKFPFGCLVYQKRYGRYFVLCSKSYKVVKTRESRGANRTGHPLVRSLGYVWKELSEKVAKFRLSREARAADGREKKAKDRKK